MSKKKLFDYQLVDKNTEVSTEAFSDGLKDFFTGGFTKSDLESARQLTEHISKIKDIKFDTNEKISIVNEKKTVLEFYIKRGKLIRSFEDELNAQIKNIMIVRETLRQVQKILSEVPPNPDEFTLLDSISDATIMPLYRKIQGLAFLGSYSFYIENNKHFENYGQRYNTNKDNISTAKRKSPLLSFLGSWFFGGIQKWANLATYLAAVRLFLTLTPMTNLIATTVGLTYFLVRSTKEGKQAYKDSKNWNKRFDALLSDAFEASAIEPNKFVSLSNKLYQESISLINEIEQFDHFKETYINNNNKVLKNILRNFKVISGVLVRALIAQGKYYRDIQTKDMRAF